MKTLFLKIIVFAGCLFLILLGSSCRDKELEKALLLSGDNRKELEKVLLHYARQPEDSLKYKAAVFLISQMPGHYSYVDKSYVNYREKVDSLYPEMPDALKKVVYSIPLKDKRFYNSQRQEDIRVVNADFLIRQIDRAFDKWENCSWLKYLAFDDFCEYLLPYRLYEEPLMSGENTGKSSWQEMTELFAACPAMIPDIENIRQMVPELYRSYDVYRPRLALPFFSQYTFDCLDDCFYEVNRFREAGVPATIDYIPHWPARNGSHCWEVIIDKNCPRRVYTDVTHPAAAKIYRRTYSRQSVPEIKEGKNEIIPEFFRIPFYKDVTDEYVNTADIRLQLKCRQKERPAYAWLTVFNEQKWQPVAWTAWEKNEKAVFRNIGCGFVYLPVYYQGQRQVNAAYPFRLTPEGQVVAIVPDTTKKISMRLSRKYPLTYLKLQWGRELPGACLEASNDPDFAVRDTLHIIQALNPDLNMTFVPVPSQKAYRYWRITKPGRMLHIGELVFHDPAGRPVCGRILAKNRNPQDTLAFDGDAVTYCRSMSWIGMDMGKAVTLGKIGYVPRTDGNGICPGDEYELFYFGKWGWESLGRQAAVQDFLEYKNVPSAALYWLHNHSKGQEERIFTYEDGKISFH